jgi:hypothetical protein
MAEQELDLLEISSTLAAELGAGTAQVIADPARWEQWASELPGCNWALATGGSCIFFVGGRFANFYGTTTATPS